jgi:hypothetical protein
LLLLLLLLLVSLVTDTSSAWRRKGFLQRAISECNAAMVMKTVSFYLFSSFPKTNPNTETQPPPSRASMKERKRQSGHVFALPIVVDLIDNP